MLKLRVVQKIIQIGNPKLAQYSVEVPIAEIGSVENLQLYQDLVDTCDKEKEGTAGLSAVQIGILKRVYVARRLDLEAERDDNIAVWQVMINPDMKTLGAKESTIWEGCMSVGEGKARLFGPVTRNDRVKVTYFDEHTTQHTKEFKGYMAHIIQHEQDHLDGKLFLKYIVDVTKLWTSEKLDHYLETHDHFPPSE